MPLPAGYLLKLNRLRRDVEVFRAATAGGDLAAAQVQSLGLMLQTIVELLEMAGQCCEQKSGGDIRIKGPNIGQN